LKVLIDVFSFIMLYLLLLLLLNEEHYYSGIESKDC